MLEENNRENISRCPVCFSDDFDFLYEKKDSKLEIADRYVKCRNCGSLFIANRLNFNFISAKFYQKRHHMGYDAYLRKKNHLKKIAKTLEKFLPSGSIMFDIGCGMGAFLKFLADKGYKVFGLEISDEAVRLAEQTIGQTNIIRKGEFLKLNFKGNFFDAVSLTDTIEHLDVPNLYLDKISKILKPQGLFIIRFPDSGSYMHRLLKSRWQMLTPRHIVIYSRKSVSFLLKRHNFEVVYCESDKEAVRDIFPPFSYGIRGFFRGTAAGILRWFFSVIGKGENVIIFARNNN